MLRFLYFFVTIQLVHIHVLDQPHRLSEFDEWFSYDFAKPVPDVSRFPLTDAVGQQTRAPRTGMAWSEYKSVMPCTCCRCSFGLSWLALAAAYPNPCAAHPCRRAGSWSRSNELSFARPLGTPSTGDRRPNLPVAKKTKVSFLRCSTAGMPSFR